MMGFKCFSTSLFSIKVTLLSSFKMFKRPTGGGVSFVVIGLASKDLRIAFLKTGIKTFEADLQRGQGNSFKLYTVIVLC